MVESGIEITVLMGGIRKKKSQKSAKSVKKSSKRKLIINCFVQINAKVHGEELQGLIL